ncbi:MAG: C40 family peptidase [Rudaea sp.]|nr:C40 family peptidase [Rudaea sp.]
MPIQRLTIAAGFFAAIVTQACACAATPSPQVSVACAEDALQAMFASELIDNSTTFAASLLDGTAPFVVPAVAEDPRRTLADFAMKLRDIRYRRGGRVPATGFDCSGFVHYVFASALGIDLPENSVSQFQAGMKIARDEMKTGDLVFFHIRGKRISHVGIYLGEGRFIHSPTTGQRVRVDRLDESYWARRFAGAKRPDVLS